MKVIGLTGGIGTGKSTVSAYLAQKGCIIIDADRIAHDITNPHMPVLEKLAQAFGEEIIKEDGSLDRGLLASIAFSCAENKRRLDEITHKEITDIIQKRITELKNEGNTSLVIVDAPLLYEAGLDRLTEAVWAVDAHEELRTARVAERDSMSQEEIIQRMKNQMDPQEKNCRADAIINNSGSKEELYREIDKVLALYV